MKIILKLRIELDLYIFHVYFASLSQNSDKSKLKDYLRCDLRQLCFFTILESTFKAKLLYFIWVNQYIFNIWMSYNKVN